MEQQGMCTLGEPSWYATVLTMTLEGELDASGAHQVGSSIERLVGAAHPGALRLDLAELRFLDAAGARALLDLAERLGRRGVDVRITHATGLRRQVLEVVGHRLLDRAGVDGPGLVRAQSNAVPHAGTRRLAATAVGDRG
jgi:anti-anti-sigma factor